jgi:hypothetical protein
MTRLSPIRRGVSLLEVMIATAMLLGAVVVLAELAQIGRRHAESAGERVVAQQLCQQKLNEVLLGLLPVTAASAPIEEVPGWVYQVEVEPLQDFAELDDLVRVRVTVEQGPQAPELARRRNRRSFRLTRWIRVPRSDAVSTTPEGSIDPAPGDSSRDWPALPGTALPGTRGISP